MEWTIHIWVGRGDFRVELLAGCLGAPAGSLRFAKSPKGKPMLENDPGLHFNVSHSDGLFAVAVTRSGPVGIDVERRRHIPEAARIAERYGLDPERFLDEWVRREAYLKALGVGLSGLRAPVEPGWHIESFVPEANFAGAWAIGGGPARALLHRWGEEPVEKL